MKSVVGVVVGAAIVRHGCVLAARRTAPAAAAGRWEFPGGKVEPGEPPADAVVREVAEELGCAVAIGGWLGGEVAISDTHRLAVATATLLDGEPTPSEHDAIRWLAPEELDDVDWLEPDRPFLAELRERLLDGERLSGGRPGGAVRVGSTVRRPAGGWTPAVHDLLAHLRSAGLPGVPRVHGLDSRGREILEFLPGEVGSGALSDARLVAVGAWTRRLHDAVAPFRHPGPWAWLPVDGPVLVAHNDLGSDNICFDGDRVVGVLDWDLAAPSTPALELGRAAWTAVPLCRRVPAAEAARRLRLLAAAYGGLSASEILHAVEPRIRAMLRETGETGQPEHLELALADLLRRLPAIDRALALPR